MSIRQDFEISIDSYIQSLEAAIKLHSSSHITDEQLDIYCSGITLGMIIAFESFIERIVCGFTSGGITHPSFVKSSKVPHMADDVLLDLISGSGGYFAWLPFGNSIKISNTIFDDGKNPFATVSDDQTKRIEKIILARNAIAHGTKYADKKFYNKWSIPPKDQIRPIRVLRKPFSGTTTHIEWIGSSLKLVSKTLFP